MSAGNLTVYNGVGNGTFTFIGGAGTPSNPGEWRVLTSAPVASQVRLLSAKKRTGSIDQIELTLHVPYTVTNTTTGVISSARRAEVHMKFNLPEDVPQAVVDTAVYGASSAVFYSGIANNLVPSLLARQSGA